MLYEGKKYCTINSDAGHLPDHNIGSHAYWVKWDNLLLKDSDLIPGNPSNSTVAECYGIYKAIVDLKQHNLTSDYIVVINCDNSTVRQIINTRKAETKNDEINKMGELLLKHLKHYKRFYAKKIRGHTRKKESRNWVNSWCDQQCTFILNRWKRKNLS